MSTELCETISPGLQHSEPEICQQRDHLSAAAHCFQGFAERAFRRHLGSSSRVLILRFALVPFALPHLEANSVKALDIQLKVLQALPSLLQNYASKLKGKLLVNAFQLCFSLHNNKTAVISNTAAAALQQLVASTFEKVSVEDGETPILTQPEVLI